MSDDFVWSHCQGLSHRICRFCQRRVEPPNDGLTVVPFRVPPEARLDRCPGFVLRPDAVPPPEGG